MIPPIINIAQKETAKSYQYQYAICTLVTGWEEYGRMMESFIKAGFTATDCQYRYVDNTAGNTFDAYTGINHFLQNSSAKYIIICHQDLLLNFDHREQLEQRIGEIDGIDHKWAVLGNAGANNLYLTSMKVTQANGVCYRSGVLPSKVRSLDENFLLVKTAANLALSGDLSGFHLYGTDICFIAECLGYSCYVIDFNLLHLSDGKLNPSFYALSGQFQKKYNRFFRGRYIKTTITSFYVSSNGFLNRLMNMQPVKYLSRLYYKIKYKQFKKY